jgi:phosphoglycolate phosphatase
VISFDTVRAVLLDLDGTLLDTAPEITAAAADMLAELGLDPVPAAKVRSFIGKGIPSLVQRTLEASLGSVTDDRRIGSGLESFLVHYAKRNGRQASTYPGVREGLTTLHAGGFALAWRPLRLA